mmetsp:Transcript_34289/g.39037  ORF Transcript_34289/g.39037 Transcript_34289/m.39037 type:complete len:147 (+) Transcript_34289:161-601(+)|eukprot:CAMPEP_0194152966 /NCGR_PEP_ID=MMETSP0152-20130528/54763_1 /TAXON_ID=1049557 /ORGANISM="Thalassiothrix antarctica, Strain L6-D1" /LENGTH=146 /DNA_ID=CAMNT_0038857953 /DNA_START=53 /DNA_END=493 /DNA_ORIENTATION=+
MSVNEVRYTKTSLDLEIRGTSGAATFVIGNEDHTLANALRHILMNNTDTVEFAGYAVPHPQDPKVHIRVQTWPNRNRDGTSEYNRKSAAEALQEACTTLDTQCQYVLDKLEEMVPAVKEDSLREEARLVEEARKEEEEDIMEEEEE